MHTNSFRCWLATDGSSVFVFYLEFLKNVLPEVDITWAVGVDLMRFILCPCIL